MHKRRFQREFKVEAVKLARDRVVPVSQAARHLDVHENVLRKWVKELGTDPVQAFPGHGQMKSEQLEIARLRREVHKLKAERDILKKAAIGAAEADVSECHGAGIVRATTGRKFLEIANMSAGQIGLRQRRRGAST
jgi:transposase